MALFKKKNVLLEYEVWFTPKRIGLEPKEIDNFDWHITLIPSYWVDTKENLDWSPHSFRGRKV